jgi:nifR3 family TIM-barrel protein
VDVTMPPPLRIGPLEVSPPVVLAPMAGVTNAPFRRLCRWFGAGLDEGHPVEPGWSIDAVPFPRSALGGLFTCEMVMARALVEGSDRTERMAAFEPDESPRSMQLYGVDPHYVGEAVRRLVGDGAIDHIDLNFGCPASKVTRKGGGAAVPVHPRLLGSIIAAAVGAAEPAGVPITVKFRLGISDRLRTDLATGRIAEGEGAAAIALHARTAEQHYAGPSDWSAIAALKAEVTSIPVLGNGDIVHGADGVRMMAETGCDGVVVGRGCLGRPWLFRDLADAFAGRPPRPAPLLGEVAIVLAEHGRLLAGWFGESKGCRELRKHTGWYLKGYPVGPEARRRLAMVSTLAEVDDLLAGLDPLVALPAEAEGLMRGHTSGPRKVILPEGWLDAIDDLTPPEGADVLVSGG